MSKNKNIIAFEKNILKYNINNHLSSNVYSENILENDLSIEPIKIDTFNVDLKTKAGKEYYKTLKEVCYAAEFGFGID